MSHRVFISFRFSDGEKYKKELSDIFDDSTKIINCSENEDRSKLSDETIKQFGLENAILLFLKHTCIQN